MNIVNNGNSKDIKRELDEILKCGFYTKFGGGFLLIPYLLQIGIKEKVKTLNIEKVDGIPTYKAVLGIINTSIFGVKRLSKLKNINDIGLAVLSGFRKLPSDSFYHNFLESIKLKDSENFNKCVAKEFVKNGLIKGNFVNFDSKFIAFWGKRRIPEGKHPTRKTTMRGIDIFITQDQNTRCPIILHAEYPRKKPEVVGKVMMNLTCEILGDNLECAIFDKWFSVGALLNYINKEIKIKFITVLRLRKNRIKEMKQIPVDKFKLMDDGRKITFIYTNVKDYEGKVRLVVIHFEEDGEKKYYGYLTNDIKEIPEMILKRYNRRQKIENFFDEANFLNIEKLPGINLNEIQAMLAFKMLAYNIVASFKRDLGKEFKSMEIETIYDMFLNNEAMVKARGRKVYITFFRHKMENVIEPLFMNLTEQLKNKGVNPQVPWLNNRTLEFSFK